MPMTPTPAGSGRRTQDDPELEKDQEFWFPDGNIVLIARTVEFRVYRGILANHSTVFADMFTLPQPASSSTLLEHARQAEECPFVVLDDSPEDLRHVLRAVLPTTQERYVHSILSS